MEKERVVEILKFFKNIDSEIKLNQKIINYIENEWYSSVGAINMDGMPHGSRGISRPTETIALNIPDSVNEQIRTLTKHNEMFYIIRREILQELSNLTYTQKVIIFDFYIKGFQWVQISERLHYSDRHCKNIRNSALAILAIRFTHNKLIYQFNFPN